MIDIDILIIGGGLSGAALMLALKGSGFSCQMVERKALSFKIEPDFDARSLALSPASVAIFQTLGLWPSLEEKATEIKAIHVSEQGVFGQARLKEGKELGFVIEIQALSQVLYQALDKETFLAPAELIHLDKTKCIAEIQTPRERLSLRAKLIVAADGLSSSLRADSGLSLEKKEYQQTAIVANLGLNRSHEHWAYERFTSQGPMAILPLKENRVAMIWVVAPERANLLMQLKDEDFLRQAQENFGYRLGRFKTLGKRFFHPLIYAWMPKQAAWPLVFIGNAAHTLHPVAGQGFNLSLRDVATLAQCILKQGLNPKMLLEYQRLRGYDQRLVTSFTHNLIRLFSIPGLGSLRGLGLLAFDNSTLIKKLFSRHASGFIGLAPDLVAGLPLIAKDQAS